jgi:hypothetical protein
VKKHQLKGQRFIAPNSLGRFVADIAGLVVGEILELLGQRLAARGIGLTGKLLGFLGYIVKTKCLCGQWQDGAQADQQHKGDEAARQNTEKWI